MNERIGPNTIGELLAMVAGENEDFVLLNRYLWTQHHIQFNAWHNALAVIEVVQVNVGIEPGEAP